MALKKREGDWTEVAIAMDRGLRLFADFSKPILSAHAADNLSTSNLLFLMSVGIGEARVNDLVKKGHYVGSNASYALKALQEGGYIDRRQDPGDRRNAVVSLTDKGAALVLALRQACLTPSSAPRDVEGLIKAFEGHCIRYPAA